MKPTGQAYGELEQAYEFFNRQLFASELPSIMITLQRKKNARGYCSRLRFAQHNSPEIRVTEIAMNPAYFGIRTIKETLSTLAHEMAHVWQFHFGKPGRRGYHNKEWGEKMESIGLMPSATGRPGGAKTGEHMTHYIIEGGAFEMACQELLTTGFTLSWYDRYAPPEYVAQIRAAQASASAGLADPAHPSPAGSEITGPDGAIVEDPGEPSKTYKTKYTCPNCKANAWGKPTLKLICGDCQLPFAIR